MRLTEDEFAKMTATKGKSLSVTSLPAPSEESEQMALLAWCKLHEYEYPELAWFHHIPNGGSRHIVEAKKLKAMGVKAGVPDLFLPVYRWPHHGLYIEMKSKHGTLTLPQKDFHRALTYQKFLVVIARSWDMARETLLTYLNSRDTRFFRECLICHRMFPLVTTKKYCSPACAVLGQAKAPPRTEYMRAYMQKRREQMKAAQ